MHGAVLDLSGARRAAPLGRARRPHRARPPSTPCSRFCRELVAAATCPVLGVGVGSPGVIDADGHRAPGAQPRLVRRAARRDARARRSACPCTSRTTPTPRRSASSPTAARRASGLLVLTVGQGVGAGIVLDGALVQGHAARRRRARPRHRRRRARRPTAPARPRRSCAPAVARGCLETVLSVPALRRRVAGLDPEAADAALASVGRRLGIVLAPVVSALNLSEVVLSGPPELLDGPLRDAALATLAERTMPVISSDLAAADDHARRGRRPAPGPPCSCCPVSSGSRDDPEPTGLQVGATHPETALCQASSATSGRNPTVRMVRSGSDRRSGRAARPHRVQRSADDERRARETTRRRPEGAEIRLWLAGGDTPQELRDYLIDTFADGEPGLDPRHRGAGLGRPRPALQTALPDAEKTPDVVEIGNTQSPTFTYAGAFRDLSDLYEELGGDDAAARASSRSARSTAPSTRCRTTSARATCSTARTCSRRPGSTVPTTLAEFTDAAVTLQQPPERRRPTSPASGSRARTGATASPGSTPTAATSPCRTAASGPARCRAPSRRRRSAEVQDALHRRHERAAGRRLRTSRGSRSTTASRRCSPPRRWARWSIDLPECNKGVDPEDDVRRGEALRAEQQACNEEKTGVFALPGVDGGHARDGVRRRLQHRDLGEVGEPGARREPACGSSSARSTRRCSRENGLIPANTRLRLGPR